MLFGKTICTLCNYIYDESVGEAAQKIPPAVKFDTLPESWQCPECGAAKEMFQPCSCVSLPAIEPTCGAHKLEVVFSVKGVSPDQLSLLKKTPVGQLAADHPLGSSVFEQYGIDYCCGGKITLEEACRKKDLIAEEVLGKLFAADHKSPSSTDPDWTKASLKDLVEHIVTTYHQPLREDLPRLAQLAAKVARVHGENHPEMVELMNVFNQFREHLELHMQKEEMILFPGIVKMETGKGAQPFGCGGGIENPIAAMTQEHDEAGASLSTMRRLTGGYSIPADACNSFRVLVSALAQIEAAMHQHVHKENNILFPRALAINKHLQPCH